MSDAIGAIGGAIGTAVGGPAGGAIGSAIGGAVSGTAAGQVAGGAGQAMQITQAQLNQARGDVRQGSKRAVASLLRGRRGATESLRAISEPGMQAFDAQAALSGALGADAQKQAFQQFSESPEQAFMRQQGEQAILRGSSATGGLGGSRVLEALQNRGIGVAAQDFQNRFNRLGAVAQPGLQAQTNLANLRMSANQAIAGVRERRGQGLADLAIGVAPQLASYAQNQANAEAAGTLGIGSAIGSGLGSLAESAGAGLFSGGSGGTGSGLAQNVPGYYQGGNTGAYDVTGLDIF